MQSLLPLGVSAVCVAVAIGLWYARRQQYVSYGEIPNYVRRESLLSPQELAYCKLLKEIIGDGYLVFPKVRLADVLRHPGQDLQFRRHWARVQRRSVDLLVCTADWAPTLAIKFGPTSRRKIPADDVLEITLEAAGVPLLRVKPSDHYQTDEITYKIKFAIARVDPESPGFSGRSMMPEPETDTIEFSDSKVLKIRRWTSDLWMAARRLH